MLDEARRRIEAELSQLMGENVSVGHGTQRELAGTRVSVVDMSYRSQSGAGDSRRRPPIQQTAVVLEQEDLNVPDFLLRPSAKGITGRLCSVLGNMGDIDFIDSPEFSQAYFLHGWIEETVRAMFVPEIRNHFANAPGWTVRGHGNKLVIYHHNQTIADTQHDPFIKDALEILTLFQLGVDALDARPDLRRETNASDMAATAQRMDGIVGTMLQRQLNKIRVTQSELDEFAASSVPRSAPPGLKRQVVGQWIVAIVVGCVMAVLGTVFAVIAWFVGEGNQRFIAFPIMLTPVLGASVAFFGFRVRNRRLRTLRNGKLYQGVITAVSPTATLINNQRQYLVDIQYGDERSSLTAQCKVLGAIGKLAQAKKDSREQVRVLIDPRDALNVLCLDLLIVEVGI